MNAIPPLHNNGIELASSDCSNPMLKSMGAMQKNAIEINGHCPNESKRREVDHGKKELTCAYGIVWFGSKHCITNIDSFRQERITIE